MKKRFQGSIAVEACLVFPIVFFIILAILYLTFYLHDRCVVQSALLQIFSEKENFLFHPCDMETGQIEYQNINGYGVFFPIISNEEAESVPQKIKEQAQEQLKEELESELWLGAVEDVTLDFDWKKVSGKVEWEMDVPQMVMPYFTAVGQEYSFEREFKVINPVEFVRIFDSIHTVLKGIKGYDKVESKIASVLKLGKK